MPLAMEAQSLDHWTIREVPLIDSELIVIMFLYLLTRIILMIVPMTLHC